MTELHPNQEEARAMIKAGTSEAVSRFREMTHNESEYVTVLWVSEEYGLPKRSVRRRLKFAGVVPHEIPRTSSMWYRRDAVLEELGEP